MAGNIAKYRKLTITGTKKGITLYAGHKVQASYKIIAEKLDAFEGGHLVNLLEAALYEGKRQGKAELMKEMDSVQKQIEAIRKKTLYKTPGRPKKPSKS